MRIATFNLRYANPKDSGNLWVDRLPVVAALIGFHDFDIFGTQEVLPGQITDLQNLLPNYSWYGLGRDDGKDKGEHSAIFFKKDKFTILNKGDFWLSQTPETVGAKGWDAAATFNFKRWAGITADVGGHYKDVANVGTYLFGPQFKIRGDQFTPFIEVISSTDCVRTPTA